jgi:hypothetical protein
MAKFPEPPSLSDLERLGVRPAEQYTVKQGARLWRIYFQNGPQPSTWNQFRAWGPTDSRFDHQPPPPAVSDRMILYAATLGRVCVAEVFQTTRTVDRRRRAPWLVAFEITRKLTLLDLSGHWPTRAGASQAINSGPRKRAQRWSRRIYEAFPALDGIHYPSSMSGGESAVALFERAEDAVAPSPSFHRALVDPTILPYLRAAVRRVGYAMV